MVVGIPSVGYLVSYEFKVRERCTDPMGGLSANPLFNLGSNFDADIIGKETIESKSACENNL